MQPFEKLQVWQRSYQFALAVYKLSKSLPSEERYGMTSQLRRASVSVSSNIAEGSKRKSPLDFAHFLNMAEGSCAEIRCLLMLSRDLAYTSAELTEPLIKESDRINSMIYALRIKVEERRSGVARSPSASAPPTADASEASLPVDANGVSHE